MGMSLRSVLTRERWLEVARILVAGAAALLYWRGVLPLLGLLAAVLLGLYPPPRAGYAAWFASAGSGRRSSSSSRRPSPCWVTSTSPAPSSW